MVYVQKENVQSKWDMEMNITLKVAEYILQQGKVNLQDISNYFGFSWKETINHFSVLRKIGMVSDFDYIPGKQIRTGARKILITNIDKIKLLLTEVVEPEEVGRRKRRKWKTRFIINFTR